MEINTDKTSLQNIFLFALFALLLVAVIAILRPFFTVILWSSLLYILISPLHRKIFNKINPENKEYNIKKVLLSGSFAVGTILIIAGLLFLLGSQLISQLISFLEDAEKFIKENPNFFKDADIVVWVKDFLQSNEIAINWIENFDLRQQIITLIQTWSNNIYLIIIP